MEICRLYYEKEHTQADIAKMFNISRPAVSKLLTEARHRGIVRIEICSPIDSDEELLGQLSAAFGIKGGLIIPSASRDDTVIRNLIVTQAALFLEDLLPDVETLGIGWGETIKDIIEEFDGSKGHTGDKRSICPVIGNAPSAVQSLQTNELARILAEKAGFTPSYLHAPAFPFSSRDRELFMGTIEGQHITKLWSQLDTILLGVGNYPTVPDQATAARFGDRLKEHKAVGVLATYYYDQQGTIIESPGDNAIRIPLAALKKTERVVVISGSPKKIRALHGALKTGLVSHLITDETTAREVLRFESELNS